MSKRILSLLLCLAMVFSTVMVAPVFAEEAANTIAINVSNANPSPGDIITYSIDCGAIDSAESMEIEIHFPTGLTYVPDSAVTVAQAAAIGWAAFDLNQMDEKTWVKITGYGGQGALAAQTLATFQAEVGDDFYGDAALDITFFGYWTVEGDEYSTDVGNQDEAFVNKSDISVAAPQLWTLTFEENGGSEIADVTDLEGTVIDLTQDAYKPSLAGHAFMGWFEDDGTFANKIESYTLTADKTVYAQFLAGYSVTYYVDGLALPTTDDGLAGDTIVLDAVPEKENYRALGWFIDDAGEAVTEVELNSNVNVYAKYEYLPLLTFANTDVDSIRANYKGEEIDLTAYNPTPADCTFVGWYEEAELTNVTTTVTLDADTTVYAKFETTLTFDSKKGSDVAPITVTKGETIDLTAVTAPTRTGYTFDGWYTDEAYANPAGDSIVLDANTTLYAKWNADAAAGAANVVNYVITSEARPNPDSIGGAEKIFSAGDTVYVDYTISSTDANFQSLGSFQFDIEYDDTKLTLESIESVLGTADGVLHTNMDTLRVNFDVDGDKEALDITGGKLVITAVYVVKAGVEGETTNLGVDDAAVLEVTPMGYDKNVEDITLDGDTVTIKNLFLTFVSGDNAKFADPDDDIVTGIRYNVAGFLTPNFDASADALGLEAHPSFRLAKDIEEDGERLWMDEATGDFYTSKKIKETQFLESKTFIAQVVDIHDVTIVAGANGTVEGTTSLVVDTGYEFTEAELLTYVTPVGNPGYTFDAFDTLGPITADATVITANFKDAEYVLSTDAVDPTLATITGVTDNQTITHGTEVPFTVAAAGDKVVGEVGYIVDGVKYPLGNGAGDYTIPGDAITGNVDIYVVEIGQFTVTFVAGANGTVSGATYPVNKAASLSDANLTDAKSKVVADPGYKFVGFAIDGSMVEDADITSKPIYADLTVTAIFDHNSYTLTQVDGVTTETVTHGTPYVFTPELDGKIITNVTATVGGVAIDPALLTKDTATGEYTLNGDAITGDVVLTAETIDGSIRFILNRQYRALKPGGANADEDVKIAVITLDGNVNSGKKYTINEGEFYWSERYGAYVNVVEGLTEEEGVTAAIIAAQLAVADEASAEVNYSGDMNNDGIVTIADAMIITDILHQKRAATVLTTELQMLQADVVVVNETDAATLVAVGDEFVSTADVDAVRKAAENDATVPTL